MIKIRYISLFFFILFLIILFLLNKETKRSIGINYNVYEYSIPVYLKINDFLNRHYNYKFLVKKININEESKENVIINTARWINTNIQKVPKGIDIIDHHPLTIVQRRLGTQDQFSDILSVLLIYLDIDSFFEKNFEEINHPLTFFKINDYWSVVDPYYGIFFVNEKGTFASMEDLKIADWKIFNLAFQKMELSEIENLKLNKFQNYQEVKDHYNNIFIKIFSSKEIDNIDKYDRGGRSYIQKPLDRLRFEIIKLLKK